MEGRRADTRQSSMIRPAVDAEGGVRHRTIKPLLLLLLLRVSQGLPTPPTLQMPSFRPSSPHTPSARHLRRRGYSVLSTRTPPCPCRAARSLSTTSGLDASRRAASGLTRRAKRLSASPRAQTRDTVLMCLRRSASARRGTRPSPCTHTPSVATVLALRGHRPSPVPLLQAAEQRHAHSSSSPMSAQPTPAPGPHPMHRLATADTTFPGPSAYRVAEVQAAVCRRGTDLYIKNGGWHPAQPISPALSDSCFLRHWRSRRMSTVACAATPSRLRLCGLRPTDLRSFRRRDVTLCWTRRHVPRRRSGSVRPSRAHPDHSVRGSDLLCTLPCLTPTCVRGTRTSRSHCKDFDLLVLAVLLQCDLLPLARRTDGRSLVPLEQGLLWCMFPLIRPKR